MSKVHSVFRRPVQTRRSSSPPYLPFFFFPLRLMGDLAHVRSLQTQRAMKQLAKAVYATRQRWLIETFWKREPLAAAAGFLCVARRPSLATRHKSNGPHAAKTDNSRYLQYRLGFRKVMMCTKKQQHVMELFFRMNFVFRRRKSSRFIQLV